jgi:hypothetical protein
LVEWVALVLLLFVLTNQVVRIILHIRLLIPLWVGAAVWIALGVRRLVQGGISPALVLGVWIAAGIWNVYTPGFIETLPGQERRIAWPGLNAALQTLRQTAAADDLVVFHVESPGREWLAEPVLAFYMTGVPPRLIQFERIAGALANDDYYRRAVQTIGDTPFVWTAIAPQVPVGYQVAEFQRALAAHYRPCGTAADRPTLRLDLYARTPAAFQPALRFGDNIGARLLSPLMLNADGSLAVRLGWSTEASVPPDTYSVALHVVNTTDDLVAQTDYSLPAGGFSCQLTMLPLRLPPGNYTVLAAVYNWQTGARLPGAALATGETGDRLGLGTVVIRG